MAEGRFKAKKLVLACGSYLPEGELRRGALPREATTKLCRGQPPVGFAVAQCWRWLEGRRTGFASMAPNGTLLLKVTICEEIGDQTSQDCGTLHG